MKKYLSIYKPFLLFLTKFFLTYLVMTTVYQFYLNRFDKKNFEVDGFTKMVAHQTADLLVFFNQNAYTKVNLKEPCVDFYYNEVYTSRIVEGCNALSVIILFIAFVIAFSGKIKSTILFCISGAFIIYIMNIVRIALLNMATVHLKEQETFLHDIVFPCFIYGIVFILWVIWVNKFSMYATKSSSE